ncbi:hypothetical protein ACR77J_07560 [Tissierella praeacuta]|uniref:hypothetical protein n=1 Tax=Tissierella praeacuta TaxID=43131 RepID=UPI003DA1CDB3
MNKELTTWVIDKGFIDWLKDVCISDYEAAKKNNLVYMCESYDDVLKDIDNLKNKTETRIMPYKIQQLLKLIKEDHEFTSNRVDNTKYRGSSRMLNWYSSNIDMIDRITK